MTTSKQAQPIGQLSCTAKTRREKEVVATCETCGCRCHSCHTVSVKVVGQFDHHRLPTSLRPSLLTHFPPLPSVLSSSLLNQLYHVARCTITNFTAMQPKNILPLEPSKSQTTKPETKKSRVLQKMARRVLALAPIRSTPLPSSPTHSRSGSPNLTSSGFYSPSRPQSPPLPLFRQYKPTATYNYAGVFVFPAPPAPPSVPPALASPTTSSIHRRRGAIVELPNEWYAKAEGYNALRFPHTQTMQAQGVAPERIRRAKSYEALLPPPTQTIRSVGLSLLSGVRRGRSAQAALCVGPSPASNPSPPRAEERERERDTLDWTNSLALSDDITISFDFDEDLDEIFEEV